MQSRESRAFSNTVRRILMRLFQVKLARPRKARARGVGGTTDDKAQISKPPLLWLAPQSDHGSAACAETEAFF